MKKIFKNITGAPITSILAVFLIVAITVSVFQGLATWEQAAIALPIATALLFTKDPKIGGNNG